MTRIAHGCFSWDGYERRSARYGSFVLHSSSYDGSEVATPFHDFNRLTALLDQKVKVVVKVLATRQSGHIGDMSLAIEPSMPEVGQEFVLGVGILQMGSCSWDNSVPEIRLQPADGRQEFWMDPAIFYKLHDQTVDLFIEATTEDFSPVPGLKKPAPGIIYVDGGIQAVGMDPEEACSISNQLLLKNHGGGLYEFQDPPPVGTKVSLD